MKLQKTVGLQAATHNLGAGWEGRRCAPLASTMWTSLAFLSWKWRFPQVRLFSDIKRGPIHERRDLVELRTFRWLDGWWMMMLMMMMMLIITLRFLLGSHVRSSSSVDANYYNYHDSNLIRSITHPLKFLRIDECAVKCSASYQYSILELIALNDLKYTPEMLSIFGTRVSPSRRFATKLSASSRIVFSCLLFLFELWCPGALDWRRGSRMQRGLAKRSSSLFSCFFFPGFLWAPSKSE